MKPRVQRVSYFNTTVADEPGTGYQLLASLADEGVDLLGFHAVPVGPGRTQLSIFPKDDSLFQKVSTDAGLNLDGPHVALIVQGDDQLGAFAQVHRRLSEARVNVFATVGISGGQGHYGCILYLRPEEFDKAADALQV